MINKFTEDYSFLSNFYPCRFYLDGFLYLSAEHAYQAMKATNSLDMKKIRDAKSPAEAKKLGKITQIRNDWKSIKNSEMKRVLLAKFSQNPLLKVKLLRTEQEFIQEGNTWGDTYWGVCRNKGKNMLGRLLMEVREELNHG